MAMSPEPVPSARCIDVIQANSKLIVARDFADPDCGLDGAVCSAVEAPALRRTLGAGFKLVTPGIRPAGAAADDQSRIVTPEVAIASGVDDLVIGRPITQAADPLEALARINKSLEVAA
jgi:orotidine-5'-phosphate decarboxylase